VIPSFYLATIARHLGKKSRDCKQAVLHTYYWYCTKCATLRTKIGPGTTHNLADKLSVPCSLWTHVHFLKIGSNIAILGTTCAAAWSPECLPLHVDDLDRTPNVLWTAIDLVINSHECRIYRVSPKKFLLCVKIRSLVVRHNNTSFEWYMKGGKYLSQ
jgi:hypothetical protein